MAPFLTALIAWMWLSESISKFELFAIFGSYLGIAMIGISKPSSQDGVAESGSQYLLGIILSLFTALGMALISTSTRKLKQINYAVIQVIYASSSTLVSGLIVLGQDYP
jgi:drug/metabolite transporter (DMT)-like permease